MAYGIEISHKLAKQNINRPDNTTYTSLVPSTPSHSYEELN